MAKFSLLICLVVFAFCAIIDTVRADACADYKERNIYQCDKDDEKLLIFNNARLKCDDGYVCNSNFIETDNAVTATNKDCQGCIKVSVLCAAGQAGAFDCDADLKGFKHQDQPYKCPSGTICNKDKTDSCQPCIPEVCARDKWTCDPSNPTSVTQNGMLGTCGKGFVCNSKYVAPCNPCIDPTGLPTTTTTSTATTTSAAEEPTTTTKSSDAVTTTGATTTTAAAATTTTATTTTSLPSITTTSSPTTKGTTPKTTTKTPPFQIPNCNDGHADTRPCRPGPPGAIYYYKCRYYSPVWYDYEVKLCRDIRFDAKCWGLVCN